MIQLLRAKIGSIQRILNFENWSFEEYPQFATQRGIGRIAIISTVLGLFLGIHFSIWLYITIHYYFYNVVPTSETTLLLSPYGALGLWQWSAYVCSFCIFHLSEFFITVLYNPTVASADSFLINHSTSYTIAAFVSWIEFFLKQFVLYYFFTSTTTTTTTLPTNPNNSMILLFYRTMSTIGFLIVMIAQSIRSVAMITAGDNFNHYIQTTKHTKHQLVTTGIYRTIRHPSYTGFFFWSIGTQLVLGNCCTSILYTIVSWRFFAVRIAYEEESLCKLFPTEYPQYISRSYTGIPFIYTQIIIPNNTTTNTNISKKDDNKQS